MPYTLIRQFNTQHAHFSFKGNFQGKPITWDTNFFTVKGFQTTKNSKDPDMRQFIDIEPDKSDVMNLTVVLKINEVNKPNILKMIIMIKHYKKLAIGRHIYG